MGSIIRVTYNNVATWLPDPSEMEWGLYDISAADTGRTEDGIMHKNMIAQKRKIKLVWHNIDLLTARDILRAVNHEYMLVYFPDVLDGANKELTMYVGDRSAPAALWWSNKKILSQVSLDFIER